MSDSTIQRYPLHWPAGRARTPPHRRIGGSFEARGFAVIRDELLAELRRLRAVGVLLSSNIRLRGDGLPYANEREPDDGGIAVYFQRAGRPYVVACDHYDRAWKNLRAIHKTVEALRAIERHGSTQMMEQAFTGFAQLPPARAAEPSWWEVLGVRPDAPLEEVKAARDRLALEHHPDRGGDGERMARINRAFDVAAEERR